MLYTTNNAHAALVDAHTTLVRVNLTPDTYMASSVEFILEDVADLVARGMLTAAEARLERAADYVWAYGRRPVGW